MCAALFLFLNSFSLVFFFLFLGGDGVEGRGGVGSCLLHLSLVCVCIISSALSSRTCQATPTGQGATNHSSCGRPPWWPQTWWYRQLTERCPLSTSVPRTAGVPAVCRDPLLLYRPSNGYVFWKCLLVQTTQWVCVLVQTTQWVCVLMVFAYADHPVGMCSDGVCLCRPPSGYVFWWCLRVQTTQWVCVLTVFACADHPVGMCPDGVCLRRPANGYVFWWCLLVWTTQWICVLMVFAFVDHTVDMCSDGVCFCGPHSGYVFWWCLLKQTTQWICVLMVCACADHPVHMFWWSSLVQTTQQVCVLLVFTCADCPLHMFWWSSLVETTYWVYGLMVIICADHAVGMCSDGIYLLWFPCTVSDLVMMCMQQHASVASQLHQSTN